MFLLEKLLCCNFPTQAVHHQGSVVKAFSVVHESAQCLIIDHIFLVAVKVLVMVLFSENRAFNQPLSTLKPYEESTKMDVCQWQT